MKRPSIQYPDHTDGSKLARKVRAEANDLSDQERARLLARALQRAYGSNRKAQVGA